MNRKKAVEKSIEYIKRKFENNPHLFLSEEDVRGHLFCELLKRFNKLQKTKDNKETIPLHLNISFFGSKGHLSERPDVVILDVETVDLYTAQRGKNLSKGFEFEKAPFGIEIKLNRNGSKNRVLKELEADLIKSKNLLNRNKELKLYVVYLDKKALLEDEDIKQFQSTYIAKIIYATPNT